MFSLRASSASSRVYRSAVIGSTRVARPDWNNQGHREEDERAVRRGRRVRRRPNGDTPYRRPRTVRVTATTPTAPDAPTQAPSKHPPGEARGLMMDRRLNPSATRTANSPLTRAPPRGEHTSVDADEREKERHAANAVRSATGRRCPTAAARLCRLSNANGSGSPLARAAISRRISRMSGAGSHCCTLGAHATRTITVPRPPFGPTSSAPGLGALG